MIGRALVPTLLVCGAALACGDATAPSAGLRFAAVSAGGSHTCALTTTGDAYCWGSDIVGQLGDGDTAQELHPVPVAGSIHFARVMAGQLIHTCGVAADSLDYCWGSNQYGQLGDSIKIQWHTPSPVRAPDGVHLHGLSVGSSHTCAIGDADAAYCWGYDGLGQLGDGDGTFADQSVPTAVSGGLTWATVSAGTYHTCGITTGGAAYCWGQNFFAELGTGDSTGSITPVAVSGSVQFASIGEGQNHTCALTATGAAYCWGFNGAGELGTGDSTVRVTPAPVAGGLTFTMLSEGWDHTCGLTSGGAAYCWGDNPAGQLGDSTKTGRPRPTRVVGRITFVQISSGNAHTCGVTAAGAVYCWGDNSAGQLGDGTTTQRSVPVRVVP